MGSTWGQWMMNDPQFDSKTLLSSKYPAVRLAGLRQLYKSNWSSVSRQFERRRDRVARTLAPFRQELASVVSTEKGDSDEAVALACRLAGYSLNRELVEPLRQLLSHDSWRVQEGAAIGLGLLGAKDRDRLEQLLDREIPEEPANLLDKNLAKEVEWASR